MGTLSCGLLLRNRQLQPTVHPEDRAGHQVTFSTGPRFHPGDGAGHQTAFSTGPRFHPRGGAEHNFIPSPAQEETEGPTLSLNGAAGPWVGGPGGAPQGSEGLLVPCRLCQAGSDVLQDTFKPRMIPLPRCENIWRDFAAFWHLHHAFC